MPGPQIQLTSTTDDKTAVEAAMGITTVAKTKEVPAETPTEQETAAEAETETTAEEVAQTETATEETTTTPSATKKKATRTEISQERIDMLTFSVNEERRRNLELAERIKQLEARNPRPGQQTEEQPAEPKKFTEAKPKLDDFDSYEAWSNAKDEWMERKFAHEQEQREEALRRELSQQNSGQHARTQVLDSFDSRVVEFEKSHPEFRETCKAAHEAGVPSNRMMDEHFLHSELGPALMLHLAQNPEEARRIAALPPGPTLVALGRLEIQLESETPDAGTSPKPKEMKPPSRPIKPVKATSTPTTDPDKMTQAEYKAWRDNGGGRR